MAKDRVLAGIIGRQGQDKIAAEHGDQVRKIRSGANQVLAGIENVAHAIAPRCPGHQLAQPTRTRRADRPCVAAGFNHDHSHDQGFRDTTVTRGCFDLRAPARKDTPEHRLAAEHAPALGTFGLNDAHGARAGSADALGRDLGPEPLGRARRAGRADQSRRGKRKKQKLFHKVDLNPAGSRFGKPYRGTVNQDEVATPKTVMNVLDPRPDYHALVRRDVLGLVPGVGGTLLDLGGGVGATAAELRAMGRVDRAGVADLVADHVTALNLDFRYAGDLENHSFLDDVIRAEGPFSCVLCLDVLEHLRDPWAIVARLHEALEPGGVMIASIPNVRNFRAVLPLVFRNRWTLRDAGVLDRTHLRFFVRSSAIELMTGSGLMLEDVRAMPSGGRAVRLFRAVTLGALNSFTDLQYVIRVRRAGPRATAARAA